MSKNKVKLLLIEDYIELNKISLTCDKTKDNSNLSENDAIIFHELIELKNDLLEVYEKVFFRFGLMDVSYLLLKDGLKNKKNQQIKEMSKAEIKNILFKLNTNIKVVCYGTKRYTI